MEKIIDSIKPNGCCSKPYVCSSCPLSFPTTKWCFIGVFLGNKNNLWLWDNDLRIIRRQGPR